VIEAWVSRRPLAKEGRDWLGGLGTGACRGHGRPHAGESCVGLRQGHGPFGPRGSRLRQVAPLRRGAVGRPGRESAWPALLEDISRAGAVPPGCRPVRSAAALSETIRVALPLYAELREFTPCPRRQARGEIAPRRLVDRVAVVLCTLSGPRCLKFMETGVSDFPG